MSLASPQFIKDPLIGFVQISTANANLDGTGTTGLLVTGRQAGTKVEAIVIKAAGTVTDGMIRIFLSFDAGVTKRLWREEPVSAATPSATAQAFMSVIQPSIVLEDDQRIYVSTEKAETFNVFAHGGDFS